jgi:putative phage-type endonuclease
MSATALVGYASVTCPKWGLVNVPASLLATTHDKAAFNPSIAALGVALQPGEVHPLVGALYERKRAVPLSLQWHRWRSKSVTATDMGIICQRLQIRGGNKYCTMNQLVRKKFNCDTDALDFTTNRMMDWGNTHEAEALTAYEAVTGNHLMREPCGFVRGPGKEGEHHVPEFIGATPDGVVRGKPILVEVKCPYFKRWQASKMAAGSVPDLYYPQVQTQMAVTGLHTVHFVQYRPSGCDHKGLLNITVVKFNPEWWTKAVQLGAVPFNNRVVNIKSGMFPLPEPPRKRKPRVVPDEVEHEILV